MTPPPTDPGFTTPPQSANTQALRDHIARLQLRVARLYERVELEACVGPSVTKRSLVFLLAMAARRVFPREHLTIEHGFGVEHSLLTRSYFCMFENRSPVSDADAALIADEMHKLIAADERIEVVRCDYWEAIEALEEHGQPLAALLVRHRNSPEVLLHRCGEFVSLYHSPLSESTGSLSEFHLEPHRNGFVLTFARRTADGGQIRFEGNDLVSAVYEEANSWGLMLGLDSVGGINSKALLPGPRTDVISMCEARHDKQLVNLAESIFSQRDQIRIVSIAGPSSAGKTTFAARLAIQLRVMGMHPVTMSSDDYYRSRDDPDHPRQPSGELDFETPKALRIDVLGRDLRALINGETIQMPKFSFVTGTAESHSPLQMNTDGGIIIMEGLFCLQPELTPDIPRGQRFNVYCAPLCQINVDDLSYVSNQTTRVVRRLSRDTLFRGRDAREVLRRWPSVRHGEERNIFPFVRSGNVDFVFNSALDYEMMVYRALVLPGLSTIKPGEEMYPIAHELQRFLENFVPIQSHLVPSRSLIREFIGKGLFS